MYRKHYEIVIDKDKLETKDYTDNFEEVLKQENIIEAIKNKLEIKRTKYEN